MHLDRTSISGIQDGVHGVCRVLQGIVRFYHVVLCSTPNGLLLIVMSASGNVYFQRGLGKFSGVPRLLVVKHEYILYSLHICRFGLLIRSDLYGVARLISHIVGLPFNTPTRQTTSRRFYRGAFLP